MNCIKNKGLTVLPLMMGLLLFNCSRKTEDAGEQRMEFDGSDAILYMNASKYGAPNPATFVYMQNRRGIWVEFCIDRSALDLWVSPLAEKSDDCQDRNWYNCYYHPLLFGRIHVPRLSLQDFDSYHYDPFHLKLYYRNNVMHLLQVYSEPSILVWFEQPGSIDFKVNALVIDTSRTRLIVEEIDRGRKSQFSLLLGKGDGFINHARVYDENRSVYARAELAANQYVMISDELATENIVAIAKQNAQCNLDDIFTENEKQISQSLKYGQFKLKGHDEMQKLLNINKRVVHSVQDFSGIMRTTSQYIYYLLWYRDAGVNSTYLSYSGMADVVEGNAKVPLKYPNVSYDEPQGKFFGQVMAGPLRKWEEDGLYFVVWSAFAHWTQTGNDTFTKGIYMANMQGGLKWLEDYCFDKGMGLFGRCFANKTPFKGSHDFGYDLAIGAPTRKWIIEWNGKPVTRTYDIYVNLYCYNVYLMLSAMTTGEIAQEYMQKAKLLEEKMKPFYTYKADMPSYGYVETEDGQKHLVDWDTINHSDFLWPVSIALFHPNFPEIDYNFRWGMYRNLRQDPKENFICAYNMVLASMDTKLFPEDSIMDALEYLMAQSGRPGKYRPMPYTIPEIDGHPFHDVMPIAYSISPCVGSVTNLGIRRLPFGLTPRPNKRLKYINNYQYQKGELNVAFKGIGETIKQITINDIPLLNSLQLPVSWVKGKNNAIVAEMSEPPVADQLIVSTIQQNDVLEGNKPEYYIEAFVHNVMVFENLTSELSVFNQQGQAVECAQKILENKTYISFEGRGGFNVIL